MTVVPIVVDRGLSLLLSRFPSLSLMRKMCKGPEGIEQLSPRPCSVIPTLVLRC